MTVDEREREKICAKLKSMARGIDSVDMEVAEFLRDVANSVAGGGSMSGLIQWAYWRVRALVTSDWWSRFYYVWLVFADMECISVDALRDIAAGCCDNVNDSWCDVDTIVVTMCDNPAIPHDLFCELDRRFGGEGSSLPELGACNPRYANEIARKLILNRPEGFSDAHDVPHHILEGVMCGAVTNEEVLAFLCEPREWSTEYAGEPEYAGCSWSEWKESDARKLRERLGVA